MYLSAKVSGFLGHPVNCCVQSITPVFPSSLKHETSRAQSIRRLCGDICHILLVRRLTTCIQILARKTADRHWNHDSTLPRCCILNSFYPVRIVRKTCSSWAALSKKYFFLHINLLNLTLLLFEISSCKTRNNNNPFQLSVHSHKALHTEGESIIISFS